MVKSGWLLLAALVLVATLHSGCGEGQEKMRNSMSWEIEGIMKRLEAKIAAGLVRESRTFKKSDVDTNRKDRQFNNMPFSLVGIANTLAKAQDNLRESIESTAKQLVALPEQLTGSSTGNGIIDIRLGASAPKSRSRRQLSPGLADLLQPSLLLPTLAYDPADASYPPQPTPVSQPHKPLPFMFDIPGLAGALIEPLPAPATYKPPPPPPPPTTYTPPPPPPPSPTTYKPPPPPPPPITYKPPPPPPPPTTYTPPPPPPPPTTYKPPPPPPPPTTYKPPPPPPPPPTYKPPPPPPPPTTYKPPPPPPPPTTYTPPPPPPPPTTYKPPPPPPPPTTYKPPPPPPPPTTYKPSPPPPPPTTTYPPPAPVTKKPLLLPSKLPQLFQIPSLASLLTPPTLPGLTLPTLSGLTLPIELDLSLFKPLHLPVVGKPPQVPPTTYGPPPPPPPPPPPTTYKPPVVPVQRIETPPPPKNSKPPTNYKPPPPPPSYNSTPPPLTLSKKFPPVVLPFDPNNPNKLNLLGFAEVPLTQLMSL